MQTTRYKFVVFLSLLLAFLSYSTALYLTEPQQLQPPNEAAQKGRILWQQKNCISCHQLYGLGGHLGPDLTNVFAKRSGAYIEAFLQSGTQVMPDYNLTKEEIELFIEFFKYTNTTGVADPTTFSKHIDGTISQP
ncbi:MAG: cytochrome c [Flavobacteriaceae bacterium]